VTLRFLSRDPFNEASAPVSNGGMKRIEWKCMFFFLWVYSTASVAGVGATNVEAIADTSVCEIVKKPLALNWRLVRLKGKLKSRFEYLAISDSGCGPIWVDYPDQAGIAPKPKFKLTKNDYLTKMDWLISIDGTASVTLVGRLDGVDEAKHETVVTDQKALKDGSASSVVHFRANGFGHLGQFKARLVLKTVEEVK
jgi:hypothetical protein